MNVRSKEEKILEFIANIVMTIICLLAVIPFALLIIASFTDAADVTKYGYQFLPKHYSLIAYHYILMGWDQIGRAYAITIVVTAIGTTVSILISSMFAYGLMQRDVPGVRVITFAILFSMLFSGGLVPSYYVYTNILHIKNTIFALLVPGLLMSGFTIILIRGFFWQNIPGELLEAAEIDGASQFHIMFRIVMPLATPILATVGLMSGVAYWNDWTNGLYYISDSKWYSIQLLLNKMSQNVTFLSQNASKLGGMDMGNLPSATMRMAIAVIAIIPILCIYPFFQKYFAKGITLGAVKG